MSGPGQLPMHGLSDLREATIGLPALLRYGRVSRVMGQCIESSGPLVSLGQQCLIRGGQGGRAVLAEVVGIERERVILLPYQPVLGMAPGWRVEPSVQHAAVPAGDTMLGRIVDALGQPIDSAGPIAGAVSAPLAGSAPNPMARPRISHILETGVRCIDSLLTMGLGQRVGIFAGSGVGKSTLLGMIARSVKADINVIALIGERGREVRDFVEKQLGPEGLARSVVVVATSDQPALLRVRAAYAAVAIAEHFRATGKQVLLTMDSVTRFAMARREIGLAAGEPPTARGYTPSVFAEIPSLCERCGTHPSGGSITAVFTVLVEGDDFNEPVADALRATLDGHIVLSRDLAHQGHYPAIDVLKSASRLLSDLVDEPTRKLTQRVSQLLALLERNRQLVEIGAYQPGNNPALDAALQKQADLNQWLGQREPGISRRQAMQSLNQIMGEAT